MFSAAGLSAFLAFPFYKSVIFYIFAAKTAVLIYFMYVGYGQDKNKWSKVHAKVENGV